MNARARALPGAKTLALAPTVVNQLPNMALCSQVAGPPTPEVDRFQAVRRHSGGITRGADEPRISLLGQDLDCERRLGGIRGDDRYRGMIDLRAGTRPEERRKWVRLPLASAKPLFL